MAEIKPGPLTADLIQMSESWDYWEINDSEDRTIAEIDNTGLGPQVEDAYAHLLAAAPDMLEALKVISADGWVDLSLTEQAEWLKKAAKTIARAEGRS